VLTLSGITKGFGNRRVLNGLDLAIVPGESVALLGPNGSGKTTTLRCIVGLSRPDSGRILIGGIDSIRDPLRARARLSYLPQKAAFPGTLSVRETLDLVARLRPVQAGAVERELEACGLQSLADANVVNLSGGERQRLAMAVAFLPAADLYLFDEASANLDLLGQRILHRRARQLVRDGRTLLFTTHTPSDVRHLATRAVVLRDGRIESDNAGAFELRRYERLLERDIWGNDDDETMDDGDRGAHSAVDDRLRRRDSVA